MLVSGGGTRKRAAAKAGERRRRANVQEEVEEETSSDPEDELPLKRKQAVGKWKTPATTEQIADAKRLQARTTAELQKMGKLSDVERTISKEDINRELASRPTTETFLGALLDAPEVIIRWHNEFVSLSRFATSDDISKWDPRLKRVAEEAYPPGAKKRKKSDTMIKILERIDPDLPACDTDISCLWKLYNTRFAQVPFDVMPTLLQAIKDVLSVILRNDNTRHAFTDKMRKHALGQWGFNSKEWVRVNAFTITPPHVRRARMAQAAEVLREKQSKQIIIDATDVYRIRKIWLDSNDPWERFAGAILVCGSRPSELLYLSKFKVATAPDKYGTPPEQMIEITGLAKKRQAEFGTRIVPVLGMDHKQLPNFIEEMRRDIAPQPLTSYDKETGAYSGEELAQLMSKVNHKFNPLIKRYFKKESLTAKGLRAIYGNMAYDLYKDTLHPPMSRNVYIGEVLGHVGVGQTAMSYQGVHVRYRLQEADPDLRKVVEELQTKIETMEDTPPATPSMTAPHGLPGGDVPLVNDEGKTVMVSRRRSGRLPNPLEHIKEKVKDLKQQGIKPTWRTLRALGYGARVISRLKKEK
jgi:hypothetical protein